MSAAHEIAQWSTGTSILSTTFYSARALSTYVVPSLDVVWPAPPSLGKTIAWGALFGAYSGAGFRVSSERTRANVFMIFAASAVGASKTLNFLIENESYYGAELPFGVALSTSYVVQKLCQSHLLPVNCFRIGN